MGYQLIKRQALIVFQMLWSHEYAGATSGWHQTGGELKVPGNMVLIPLPPYSPELNPMETVWEYLRGNQLSASVWRDYDAIVKACAKAWNWFARDPDRTRTIGTRAWASVNV